MKYELNNIYNEDCLEAMKQIPDKYFDLCIVDPPYGIGISSNPVRQQHTKKKWDSAIPNKSYFNELKRVSKNQIIWGGNYFINYLENTQCFLIWDKKQPFNFSLAMCELAWTSFKSPAKIFYRSVLKDKNKIHPTQKPVALYEWLLNTFAKKGDKIAITGRIESNKKDDKTYWDVTVEDVELIGGKKTETETELKPVDDDSLPF